MAYIMYTYPGEALFLGVLRDGLRNDYVPKHAQHVVLLAYDLQRVNNGWTLAPKVMRDNGVKPM